MRAFALVAMLALIAVPFSLAHNPPGPVMRCQPPSGEVYHDYGGSLAGPTIGVWSEGGTGWMSAGDGNVEDCGPSKWTITVLNDNSGGCQRLKAIRDNESGPTAYQAAKTTHDILCREQDIIEQTFLDYDGEWDHGNGGVILAVTSGDEATWGSLVCYGMSGHHDRTIAVDEWPDGAGPAFTVAADYSRTPPPSSSKRPNADCGDAVVEPCDGYPPNSSTQPSPVNVVVDNVYAQMYALFGFTGNGTTCNLNDCAERNAPAAGHSFAYASCDAGVDGTYMIFIEPDLDAPDTPLMGHVWSPAEPDDMGPYPDDCGLFECDTFLGCENQSGAGGGGVTRPDRGHRTGRGTWTDGCGGKRCDDDITGTYDAHYEDESGGWFQIVEHREKGLCLVFCNLDGDTAWARGADGDSGGSYVRPQEIDGHFIAEFACYTPEWSFYGFFSSQTPR